MQLTLRYEHSTILIMHKKISSIKYSGLINLFEFSKFFGRITTYNFVRININNSNYAYYNIVQLKLQYEHSITLILHKISVRCIRNCGLKKLLEFFKKFGLITIHNFVKINIITFNYI
jgi:hypothetical protein